MPSSSGYAPGDAVVQSVRVNWWPVLLTSVTTVISFLTMNFADSPPLQQMGTLVAVGVTAAWILCVTFFLAILCVLKPPKRLPLIMKPASAVGAASVAAAATVRKEPRANSLMEIPMVRFSRRIPNLPLRSS